MATCSPVLKVAEKTRPYDPSPTKASCPKLSVNLFSSSNCIAESGKLQPLPEGRIHTTASATVGVAASRRGSALVSRWTAKVILLRTPTAEHRSDRKEYRNLN
nr:hypothetical protein Iba_chr10fCG1160 [Ipomoea batatas]